MVTLDCGSWLPGFYCLLGIVSLFREEIYGILRFNMNFSALVEILAFSHITYGFLSFHSMVYSGGLCNVPRHGGVVIHYILVVNLYYCDIRL